MDSFVAKNWASMIRPIALEMDADKQSTIYGKFITYISGLLYKPF